MSSKSMREQLAKRLKENQERNESFGGGLLFKDEEAKKRIWKCGEGKHIIDILPYEAGKFDPSASKGEVQYVYEYYFHANLGIEGKNQVMCLNKTYGKPCPICEDIARLKKNGEDEDVIKALMPKRNPKSVYNIICYDKGEEKKGVQLFVVSHWFMGKHLLELATVPIREGMDEKIDPIIPFMDPDEGKSVYFRREGTGPNDTKYYGHQLLDRPKGFKISKDVLDDCFCLDEIIKIPTYDEVLDIYKSGKATDDDDADRPSRRARATDDDDEKPSRSRRRDEDDDERPARKSKQDDDVQADQCEFGHKFGKDANKYPDDCEQCDQWRDCVKKTREAKLKEKEESDEKPARRQRDEDEEKPSRSSRREKDEDEDEKPTRSRRSREDEDEDERPSRRRAIEDEDEKPSKREHEEDEDEKPSRRRARR